jgi:hypothetical protein
VSRTPVQSEAQKADRIEKLQAMSTSQSFSPAIRKLAAMQLRLMKSGVSEQEAGRQVGQSIIDELNEGREQGKALAGLYHNATDEVTRRAIRVAQKRHSDALAASIKEHQTQKRR